MTKHHHVAVRVSDMERGTAFYRDAFGAEVAIPPFTVEGEFAEVVAGGPAGVRWRTSLLGLADGAAIELFAFDAPRHPMAPVAMASGNQLHFCLQVEDVPAALARVEAAGGRRLWPDVADLEPGVQVVYVADPDGNVIELIDVDLPALAGVIARAFG